MLTTGTRIGVYEIVAPLGAGGMGEVYRARDTRLNRDVAIKVLPDAVTHDAERIARFEREAQLLAALNHPHIAAIYGLEQSGSSQYLVLELVDGETLADKLRGLGAGGSGLGPGLGLGEALAIARQIADALQAAHEKAIIHRDLKPANIALTHDGQVKVLDFGLAKLDPARSGESGGSGGAGALTHSPTLTIAATQAGVILGTAAYMSPEQAKGKIADKRTDIWAFGCVLYEMLTGRRAFDGEDVTETIAAVVRGEPDWNAIPADVPQHVVLLSKRCLVKDRQARIRDIAVASFLLDEASPLPHAATARDATRSRRGLAAAALLGVGAGAVVALALATGFRRQVPPSPRTPSRFALTVPFGLGLGGSGNDRNVVISPDGTVIAYRGATQTGTQLYVRPMGDLNARGLLTESLDVRAPFFSPDGLWIAFFAGQELKKVPVSGGTAFTICRVQSIPRGATWTADGTIVFATADNAALMSVPATGGAPQVFLAAVSEGVYAFPFALPSGAVLFTLLANATAVDNAQIGVVDRATGRRTILLRGGSSGQYTDGLLMFAAAGGNLRAVRFDADRLAVIGEPVSVVTQLLMNTVGAASFSVSRTGTLLYVAADANGSTQASRSIVWVDRNGRETPTDLPSRAYGDLRLSPDGTRVAAGIRDQQSDIWVGDLIRHTLTRLTFDPTVDQAPVWTPDGRRIVWSSQRGGGVPSLFIQSADGTGKAEALLATGRPLFPTSVSPDGARVVFWENNQATAQDVMFTELQPAAGGKARTSHPLVQSPAIELDAEVSPDGHWLAFESNESGQQEVYVRPFPDVDRGRWQVSTSGGTRPAWAASNRELFYIAPNGLLTAVPFRTTDSNFEAGTPSAVWKTAYYPGFTGLGLDLRGYEVSRDGQRFLVLKEAATANPITQATMVVVLNWSDELKNRMTER